MKGFIIGASHFVAARVLLLAFSMMFLFTLQGCGLRTPVIEGPRTPLTISPPLGRVVAEGVRIVDMTIGGLASGNIPIGGMAEAELNEFLMRESLKRDIMPQNASVSSADWGITPEKPGRRLDIVKTRESALSAERGKHISFIYSIEKPEVTAADLKHSVKKMSSFTTPLLDRSRSRVKNIRLAAEKMDGILIAPGEEFSFNRTTGRKTKADGYKKATIIVKTPSGPKHAKATGGGVCQLSTTLYNAVLKAGLQVSERHEHSDEVYYVEDGKDATVTYDTVDFKFVNSGTHPIKLKIYVGRKTVRITLYENTALT